MMDPGCFGRVNGPTAHGSLGVDVLVSGTMGQQARHPIRKAATHDRRDRADVDRAHVLRRGDGDVRERCGVRAREMDAQRRPHLCDRACSADRFHGGALDPARARPVPRLLRADVGPDVLHGPAPRRHGLALSEDELRGDRDHARGAAAHRCRDDRPQGRPGTSVRHWPATGCSSTSCSRTWRSGRFVALLRAGRRLRHASALARGPVGPQAVEVCPTRRRSTVSRGASWSPGSSSGGS